MKLLKITLFSLVLASGSAATAGPVQWRLEGVKFSDGGSAHGSFMYDADTLTFSNIFIETTGSIAFSYRSVVASNAFALDVNTGLEEVGSGFLQLTAKSSTFANSDGIIELGRNVLDPAMYSWESVYQRYSFGVSHGPVIREIVEGVVTSRVSEPATLILVLSALLAMTGIVPATMRIRP